MRVVRLELRPAEHEAGAAAVAGTTGAEALETAVAPAEPASAACEASCVTGIVRRQMVPVSK